VEAFEAASRGGVDGIELDVWQTSDGAWVVHHDRSCAAGPLDHLRRAEVPAGVPELADALAACRVEVVNVELKVPPEAGPAETGRLGEELAAVLSSFAARGSGPELVLSSFSAPAAGAALRSSPNLRVGLLVEVFTPGQAVVEEGLGYWGMHVDHSMLGANDIAVIHRAGLQAVAWTVDEPDEMRRLAAARVDVLICNEAALALQVLGGL